MKVELARAGLSRLVAEAEALGDRATRNFGRLGPGPLNWKPDANEWSVGQCLDHLIRTNRAYFPTFEAIARGEKTSTLWERLPLLPRVWGRMLIRVLGPDSPHKVKAPKIFEPSRSAIEADVIPRFVEQQRELIAYMRRTEGLDLEAITISSPASRLITYRLIDAYRIIVVHELNHFAQAERVLASSDYRGR